MPQAKPPTENNKNLHNNASLILSPALLFCNTPYLLPGELQPSKKPTGHLRLISPTNPKHPQINCRNPYVLHYQAAGPIKYQPKIPLQVHWIHHLNSLAPSQTQELQLTVILSLFLKLGQQPQSNPSPRTIPSSTKPTPSKSPTQPSVTVSRITRRYRSISILQSLLFNRSDHQSH